LSECLSRANRIGRMSTYFIPYTGEKPATIVINGHRLVLLCSDRRDLEDSLSLFGADSIRGLEELDSEDVSDISFKEITSLGLLQVELTGNSFVQAGVVIAPEDIDIHQVVNNLAKELPWIQ